MKARLRGLPERLPEGERILWQGAPDWRVLACRTFHIRKLALYFGALVAWVIADAALRGEPPPAVAVSFLRAAGLAAVPLALVSAYAWCVARGSVYTVTDRRVVMRIGIALPLTINLPFAKIDAAGLNERAGDIALRLRGGATRGYVILWPHARPWRLGRAEPTLRGLRDAGSVARILSRSLAASADMPAPILQEATGPGATTPASAMPA